MSEAVRADARLAPALCSMLLSGSTAAGLAEHAPAILDRPLPVASAPATPVRRLLVSGHSLTDRPFPDHLAGLAEAEGRPIDWNTQHRWGSSISDRTRGDGRVDRSGYRSGVDRTGAPADVIADLERRAAAGAPYDALILAERHTLLGELIDNDTVGHALDFHDRFVAHNPSGRTLLFASWLDRPPGDPARWIAYERAAAPVWACVAARINSALGTRGRRDRVELIPAAAALAALVERAIGPDGVPGLSAPTPDATLARLFVDEVHPTPVAAYFVALIAHGVLRGATRPPDWTPPGVAPESGAALRRFAAAYLRAHRRTPAPSPVACLDHARRTYLPLYLAHQRDTRWRREGAVRAYARWARYRVRWSLLLRGASPRNPFAIPNPSDAAAGRSPLG